MWNTSCDPATNPAPDYGLSACAAADGTTPPWAPDMMGGIVALGDVDVTARAPARLDPAERGGGERGWRAAPRCSCRSSTPRTRCRRSTCRSRRATGGTVGGTVPATLSLTLGRAGGVRRVHRRASRADYFATTTATVISTAGDAALSVADPSSNATGPAGQRLVRAAAAAPGGRRWHLRGGRRDRAATTTIKTWSAPTSNETVTIGFKQSIAPTSRCARARTARR